MNHAMIELLLGARRGVSHPNTDLDAQTFLLRAAQVREEMGHRQPLAVDYRPQVSPGELRDRRVLIWDIGRVHDPASGNFDHHQDHALGATPILLLQALGHEPTALDEYVDRADRGYFFRHPQPQPFAETLQGLGAGINLVHKRDEQRSVYYQRLLTWVEEVGVDPYGRFDERALPAQFRPFLEAKRVEEEAAEREAERVRWLQSRIGKVAVIESEYIGVMHALYRRGAVLVVLHEPRARISGWLAPAPKYTIGANPALVAVPDELDLRPLFGALSALEPGGNTWGGQAGIGGSPREEGGSGLSLNQVMAQVERHLS
ncbi:MAG: hypothetical protein ACOY94_15335 [Bacillota bacterium]